MMKQLLLAGAALLVVAAAAPALAADIPAPVYKAPIKAPPPSYDWTGFYIGADVGGRWMDPSWTTTCLETGQPGSNCNNLPADAAARLAANNPISFSGTSFRAGGFAGYNWQVSPVWVIGLEGDLAWGNKSVTVAGIPGAENPAILGAPGADSSSIKETWDGSIRARAGLLVVPTVLAYATGGVAFAHYDASAFCGTLFPVGWCGQAANIGRTDTIGSTRAGWTIGGGLEGMLTRNWLVRAEYRYSNYGSFTGTLLPGPASNIDALTAQIGKLNNSTVLVGLAYKFDPWSAPVVSKY